MDNFTITAQYFLQGDYIRTSEGVGIVAEDEAMIKTEQDLRWSEVRVQHKHGLSANPENAVRKVERGLLHRITKEEWDEEKE